MHLTVVDGDLLDQDVEVIVNAWNRNIIPWWLLLPQGVSGAIKRRAGTGPFRELARHGAMPLGAAIATSAGRLPFRAIIHVAGINMWWRSSPRSVRDSVRNALAVARERGYASIALPLVGAGSGGGNEAEIEEIMLEALSRCEFEGEVRLVRFARSPNTSPRGEKP
ncbi:MAG: macro domain-containing protein [Thermoanaerobaculia bacterium]